MRSYFHGHMFRAAFDSVQKVRGREADVDLEIWIRIEVGECPAQLGVVERVALLHAPEFFLYLRPAEKPAVNPVFSGNVG